MMGGKMLVYEYANHMAFYGDGYDKLIGMLTCLRSAVTHTK